MKTKGPLETIPGTEPKDRGSHKVKWCATLGLISSTFGTLRANDVRELLVFMWAELLRATHPLEVVHYAILTIGLLFQA